MLQHPFGVSRPEGSVGRQWETGVGRARRQAAVAALLDEGRTALDTVLISLYGDFDRVCERPFGEELGRALDEQATALVLDLHGLKFIDTPGLRMLFALDGTARDDGLDFTVLCDASGGVRQLLRETGLDGVLPLVDDAGAVPASDSPV